MASRKRRGPAGLGRSKGRPAPAPLRGSAGPGRPGAGKERGGAARTAAPGPGTAQVPASQQISVTKVFLRSLPVDPAPVACPPSTPSGDPMAPRNFALLACSHPRPSGRNRPICAGQVCTEGPPGREACPRVLHLCILFNLLSKDAILRINLDGKESKRLFFWDEELPRILFSLFGLLKDFETDEKIKGVCVCVCVCVSCLAHFSGLSTSRVLRLSLSLSCLQLCKLQKTCSVTSDFCP